MKIELSRASGSLTVDWKICMSSTYVLMSHHGHYSVVRPDGTYQRGTASAFATLVCESRVGWRDE